MSKKSGPRSDVVFNSLALTLGAAALVIMVGFLIAMSVAVGIAGYVPKGIYVAFFAIFWVEVVLIALSAHFAIIQWVRNMNPKIVLGVVMNASALAMLLTFIAVMIMLGNGAHLILIG